MHIYLMAHGFDIWQFDVDGYVAPSTPQTNQARKRASENNAKAMNAILSGLYESEFVKAMYLTSTKEMQDKLQRTYEGDNKVKKEKLQTQRENLKV